MEGSIHLEAKVLGVLLRAPFMPNDNPLIAVDNLIFREEKNRKSLYNSWKSKKLIKTDTVKDIIDFLNALIPSEDQ